MRRCNYELSRVVGMRSCLTVLNATSLSSKTSIVSMRGTRVVFLMRLEGLELSAKCFRGLHILSILRDILILRWDRICSTSNP